MKKKGYLIALIVVLALLVLLALAGFVVVKMYLHQIQRTDPVVTDIIAPEDEFFDVDEPAVSDTTQVSLNSGSEPVAETPGEPVSPDESAPAEEEPEEELPVIDPADVEWEFIERIEDDHLINILLVGQDRRPGEVRARSDSMILCSINPETGEVSLISFLRDLYVQIPGGYSDNRLNSPYVFGGFPLLDETLLLNFGITVDANFEVDFDGFKAIIDMVGGVDVDLTEAEADYFTNWLGVPKNAGAQRFYGADALSYAQIRKIDSDFGRTSRQRTVLLAVYEKIKDLPAGELLNLMYNALPYLTTDLTDSEILSLAYRLLPLVPSLSIGTYTVPANNAYYNASIRGMSVLVPYLQTIRDQLESEYLPLN